nr:PAS domain S-box protein [Halosolutus gelatinilyticus]
MGSPGPTSDVTNDDLRGVFGRSDRPSTPLSTAEVAEALECPRRTARRCLEDLAERGEIQTKLIDDSSRVWWKPDGHLSDTPRPNESQTNVIRDATERREYEQQLEKRVERLERELDDVFDRVDDGFYALDDEFQFEYVNERAEAHFGESAQKLLGRKPWEVFDVDESDPIFEPFETALAAQEPASFERYSNPLGIWAKVRIYPSESGLSVYFRDITDRKKRERELERAHDLLEKTERVADVGGWEIDPDTLEVFWTANLFEILEAPYDEEPSLDDALDVYHEDDRPVVESAIEDALASGTAFDVEVRCRTADDDVRWLRVKGDPDVADGDVVSLRGAIQDVTERKKRERELHRIRDRMEFALNATDAVVWDWNVEDDEASFYPSAKSLYGTEIGTLEDFVEEIHPEDRQMVRRGIENSLETGEPKYEEIRFVRGEEVRWIEAPGYPVRDDDGPTRMVGVVRDITERKTYEHKLKESNERLEQFAYAASHDLQEPLRMVSSYLRIIEDRYADELDEAGEEFIEFAADGADRMREMIDGLLEYSRIETRGDPFERVDLNAVLEAVLADLQFRIEEHDAEITTEDLPDVRGDASQLRQLFQNLLENAIEYSGDEPPRVRVSATRTDGERVLSISDEGIGIDPEDQDRIFEVFQRLHTQDEHAGTGIGLALCKRIAERHGGEIQVDSELGEGATFSVSLPTPDATE